MFYPLWAPKRAGTDFMSNIFLLLGVFVEGKPEEDCGVKFFEGGIIYIAVAKGL